MKWVALFAALAFSFPLLLWLRGNDKAITNLFFLIGILPFLFKTTSGFDMALVSFSDRLGLVQGMEVSMVDIVALAIYLSLPKSKQPLPFRYLFLFYLFTVLASVVQADEPSAAFLFFWQTLRVYFLFIVIVRASKDERVPMALMTGLGIGLCIQLLVGGYQRFGLHWLQAHGTFVHQNTLGMVTNMVLLPHLAMLLAGSRKTINWIVPVGGCLVVALTTSRATIGLSAVGIALTYAILSSRRFTFTNAAVGAGGLLLILALSPLVASSFHQRFTDSPLEDDYGEREAFIRAASLIIADHPLGVGVNHYVETAKYKGYSARAGVYKSEESMNQHVHNSLFLTAAEAGYPGLIALVLLILRPAIVALHCGWIKGKDDRRGSLLLGLASSLIVLFVHSNFEWIFLTIQLQYFFAISLGLIAGLAQQLGYWSTARTFPRENAPIAPSRFVRVSQGGSRDNLERWPK